jgi:hypothetical protein
MSDDSIKDKHEDRITRRDLLQANATLIAGVLIFLTIIANFNFAYFVAISTFFIQLAILFFFYR